MQDSARIILDSNNNTFYAGQLLTGRLECSFVTEKAVLAIRVDLKGIAKTRWSVRNNSRRSYWAEEIYINEKSTLVEAHGNNDLHLAAGVHVYPFSYVLPNGLPSSYSEIYGSIKYKIRLIVETLRKPNYKHILPLKIISPLDLNTSLTAREPFIRSTVKSYRYFIFNSKSVILTISLPFTGYVANQKIRVGSHVQNTSHVNVKSVRYQIRRNIKFTTHHPVTKEKYVEDVIADCVEGNVGAHAEKSWTSILVVHPDSILNFTNCSIMNVEYNLQVEAIMPFPHSNLNITCPLMFGTFPLLGCDSNTLGSPATVPILGFDINALRSPSTAPSLGFDINAIGSTSAAPLLGFDINALRSTSTVPLPGFDPNAFGSSLRTNVIPSTPLIQNRPEELRK